MAGSRRSQAAGAPCSALLPGWGTGSWGPPSYHSQLGSLSAAKPLRWLYVGPRKALTASLNFHVALEAGNKGATVSGPVGTISATRATARAVTRRRRAARQARAPVSPASWLKAGCGPQLSCLQTKALLAVGFPGSSWLRLAAPALGLLIPETGCWRQSQEAQAEQALASLLCSAPNPATQ